MRKAAVFPFALISVLVAVFAVSACSGDKQTESETEESVAQSTAAVTAQPDPSCVAAKYGSHDYWVCSGLRDFQDAKATCESVGMHLARIDDAAENAFVRSKLASCDAWIGATDSATEGSWRWVNDGAEFWSGSWSGAPVAGRFEQWHSFEPNNLIDEDCAVLAQGTGDWNDTICGLPNGFVCESSAGTAPQPQAPDTACTRSVRNGAEYWVCNNARTWDEARTRCTGIGMDLASIEDAAEASFVGGKVTRDVHIGLSDRSKEGAWSWSGSGQLGFCSGTTGRTPADSYSNWASGEPAKGNDCKNVVSGSKGYWLCNTTKTWPAASTECASSGMTLARIDSAAENTLIASAVTGDTWIGGSDTTTEGRWIWADGAQFWSGAASGSSVGGLYKKWASGEPNNLLNEDCAAMAKGSGNWRDEPCDSTLWVPSFTCEGGAQSELPNRIDCAYTKAGGTWFAGECAASRGYVCETIPASAYQTLDNTASSIRDDHLLGAPRVNSAVLQANSQVTKPFLRDLDRYGLRACVDGLEPQATPTPGSLPGTEQVLYTQSYKGIRVLGRGYSVEREVTSKRVVSLSGNLQPNLELDTTALVTQATALATAAATVGKTVSAYSPAPVGELVVLAKKRAEPTEWELAWLFRLTTGPKDDGDTVGVSARTGQVVLRQGGLRKACGATTADPPTGAQTPIAVNALQQSTFGDPSSALARFVSGNSGRIALYSTGHADTLGTPVRANPVFKTLCGLGDTAPVATLASSPVTVPETSFTDEQYGAGLFMAMQRCVDFLAQDVTTSTGAPWIGIDGTGTRSIDLRLYSLDVSSFGYSGGNDAIIINPNQPVGASLETACHELGHAIWARSSLPTRRLLTDVVDTEVLSIDEGFGDILGSAAEMATRGYPGPNDSGWCVAGDQYKNATCFRHFADPSKSMEAECRVIDAATGNPVRAACPNTYLGPNYCPWSVDCRSGPKPNCCDEHVNATIFDHWFYLVTNGKQGTNEKSCSYNVSALPGGLGTAVRDATRIVFNAIRDTSAAKKFGFPALAQATLAAANKYYQSDTAPVRAAKLGTLVDAWNAVGVMEAVSEESAAKISPARGAKKVNPWTTFKWPAKTGETAWDFQLSNTNFSSILVSRSTTEVIEQADGQRVAQISVALPENSVSDYVWRVRNKDAAGPDKNWKGCDPIHWFEDTGALAKVTPTPLAATGAPVEPGLLSTRWTKPEAGSAYRLFISTTDSKCDPLHPGVSTTEVQNDFRGSRDDGTQTASLIDFNMQPNTAYSLSFQAVGPLGFDNKPAVGPCTTVPFTTGALPAPEARIPEGKIDTAEDGLPVYDIVPPFKRADWPPPTYSAQPGEPLRFVWLGVGGPSSYELNLFRKSSAGACATTALTVPIPNATCEKTHGCFITVPGTELPQHYPGGFCWNVVSIAKNLQKSPPSATRKYAYEVAGATPIKPGVLGPPNFNAGEGIIAGNSYGNDVDFAWTPFSGALRYKVELDPVFAGTRPAFSEVVNGTSKMLNGMSTGRGRYKYAVRPILPDPANAAQEAADQPRLKASSQRFTYVTGSAPPVIWVDPATRPDPSALFSTKQIKGKVTYPFVAASRYSTMGSDKNVAWQMPPWCTAWALVDNVTHQNKYVDIYDCERTFSIVPAKDKTYAVKVDSWTLKPDGSKLDLPAVVDNIQTSTCGWMNKKCCTSGPKQCEGSLSCVNNICGGCAGDTVGAGCCNGSCKAPLTCANGSTCSMPASCTKPVTPTGLNPGSALNLCTKWDDEYPEDGVPIFWNAVPGATSYEVQSTTHEGISDGKGCYTLGQVAEPPYSAATVTSNETVLRELTFQINATVRVVSWAVVAINDCGRSEPSAPIHLVVLP